jgi:hypothetical protein
MKSRNKKQKQTYGCLEVRNSRQRILNYSHKYIKEIIEARMYKTAKKLIIETKIETLKINSNGHYITEKSSMKLRILCMSLIK